MPPLSFAATRFIIAGLILAVLIRLQRIPLPQLKAEWKITLILASIGLIVLRKDNQTIESQEVFYPESTIRVLKNES